MKSWIKNKLSKNKKDRAGSNADFDLYGAQMLKDDIKYGMPGRH